LTHFETRSIVFWHDLFHQGLIDDLMVGRELLARVGDAAELALTQLDV
jgi:hypothetical protein